MKRILFIDDEGDLFPVMNRLFAKENYRVVCAADGLEGLLKFRNEDFDLIISDFKMPKLDGLKFYLQVRDLEETKKQHPTPILFVSAWADELRSKTNDWINCDFLSKPYQMYELTQKAQTLMGEQGSHLHAPGEGKICLAPGETLFDEGDCGTTVYYLVSGKLSTLKRTHSDGMVEVGKIYPGELVGELGVIDKAPRSLKVMAEEACELIMIPGEKILSIISTQPKWIRLMLDNLSRRLRSALKQIE